MTIYTAQDLALQSIDAISHASIGEDLASEAIERSVSHSETARASLGPGIEEALEAACTGSAPEAGEYWGETREGEQWRIKVLISWRPGYHSDY